MLELKYDQNISNSICLSNIYNYYLINVPFFDQVDCTKKHYAL